MVHPILAIDIARERQRDLLCAAQHQQIIQSMIGNHSSRTTLLRTAVSTVLVALAARLAPQRRPAIQSPTSCVCYID